MGRWPCVALAAVVSLTACKSGDDDAAADRAVTTDAIATAAPASTVPLTTASTAAANNTTTTTTSITTTRTTPATSPAPTTVPVLSGLVTDALAVREIGRSVEGRPITAVERGTPGGIPILVIGVIHGDEDDGVAILERLATAAVPPGIDLWLVESINPDGQAAQQRGNAAGVDLNRNFPHDWGPIDEPGDPEYAGTGPASEPETQAVVAFAIEIRPALGLWYHQDLDRLSPGTGLEGRLKERYSELTGVPILRITGGTYTGVAATWQRNALDSISFIVELGPTLSPAEADAHAAAVLEISTMVVNG
ncbi:MAG: M14 family zinc carboxypeptidase [Ilumatobacteraceae bacterium]